MAKKLVLRCENNDVWVFDLDEVTGRKLEGDELCTMNKSLKFAVKNYGVKNAILGDDITEKDADLNSERLGGGYSRLSGDA